MSREMQKAGANARASGRSIFDNPLYQSKSLPAVTGEAPAAWQAKVEAWELGWRMEDLIRS